MALNLTNKDLTTKRVGRKSEVNNSVVFGKLPPQNKELEEAVLGAILLEKDKLSDVLEILPNPECFYVDAHQKIFASIIRTSESGNPVDILTVTEDLKKSGELEIIGGAYYVTKLTMGVVTSANVIAHARIVMEKFIQRELIRICGQILTDSYEDRTDVFDLLDKAETELFEVGNSYLRKNYTSLSDVLVQTIEQIEKAKNEKEEVVGVPSGFPSLDNITSGWQKTDLIILAARPSVGKTAFALNLAINAALHPKKPMGVAIFSLEMSSAQLVKRMLSAVTEVSLEKLNRGTLEDHEFEQLTHRMDRLGKAPIFLDDQAGLNIFELRAKCRRLKSKHDIQLILIDYLQLMHAPSEKGGGGNREQEISKISRELKGLAKELEVPIIALSQLSRAVETRSGDKGKIPQLSDLRESGAIEQDADMVMFIYRPDYYGIKNDEQGESVEGETHINIAKHRNGKLAQVRLQALLHIQKFVEIEEDNWTPGGQFDPQAGIRKNYDDFGDSKLMISNDFQTKPSKMNDLSFDDDEHNDRPMKGLRPSSFEDDAPF